MYEKTVVFEKFEKNGLFEAKNTKNARKTNFDQVKKWSKNVFPLSKIDFFWYISNALLKIRHVCFYPSDTQKVEVLTLLVDLLWKFVTYVRKAF